MPNWANDYSAGQKLVDFKHFCRRSKGMSVNVILGSSTSLHGIDPRLLGESWFNASTRGQNLMVSTMYAGLLRDAANSCNKTIDTLLLDVYPELNQEWVVNKQDAVEDMVQSLPLVLIIQNPCLLTPDPFRKIHARTVNFFRSKESKKRTSQLNIDQDNGYESLQAHAYSDANPLVWHGVIHAGINFDIHTSDVAQTIIYHNPPTLHTNHITDFLDAVPPPKESQWIDGHVCRDQLELTDFNDDHHLNLIGAQKYSKLLAYHLHR